MREPEVIEYPIIDGYSLQLGGAVRSSDGGVHADAVVLNGDARYVARVELNQPDDRAAWATRIAGMLPIPEDASLAAMLRAFPDVLALLQDETAPDTSQAARLVDLAEGFEYFHDGQTPYVMLHDEDGTSMATPVDGRPFRRHLSRLYRDAHGGVVNGGALDNALHTLGALAVLDHPERLISVRIAGDLEHVWFDLADGRRIIAIGPDGWRVEQESPFAFLRPHTIQPLPVPTRPGNLEALRPFVNVGSEENWVLLVSWLVGALHPRGPYPLLVLQGEQGSAKTSTARVLLALIDPSRGDVRAAPRGDDDLFIAAKHAHVLAFDNLSGVSTALSDSLCRLSTGGGVSKRQLYTDADEIVLSARRPLILTGIDALAIRGDLQDRSIVLDLPRIGDTDRRPEAEMWAAFEQARPSILAGLLDAVSAALRTHEATPGTGYPRMADFARWIAAAESALPWTRGAFLAAYAENRSTGAAVTLEASPIVPVLSALLDAQPAGQPWDGSPSAFLEALESRAGEGARRRQGWPRSPAALGRALKRMAPALRTSGIECDLEKRTGRERRWTLEKRATGIPVIPVTRVTHGGFAPLAGDGDDGSGGGDDATVTRPGTWDSPPALKNDANDANDANHAVICFQCGDVATRLPDGGYACDHCERVVPSSG